MQPFATSLRRGTAVLISVVVLSGTGLTAASANDKMPTLPKCYEVEAAPPPPSPAPDVEVCYPF